MKPDQQVLIFTDLDGTLLDHDTYSHEPVDKLLAELKALDIPVIPVTSKTKAEVLEIRESLGLDSPFVCENGAAIYLPKNYFSFTDDSMVDQGDFWCKAFAPPRAYWNTLIESFPEKWRSKLRSFTEMGVTEIADTTALPIAEARLANTREYSEPILWCGTEQEKLGFIDFVHEHKHTVLQGGRFLHLTTGYDKGQALMWLKQQFMRESRSAQTWALALGDSGNDIEMLEASDQPVIVKSKTNEGLKISSPVNEIRTLNYGPKGWDEAVRQLLNLGGTESGQ
jgi:mannosyl-3-phosphoglycerate phosphatase